MSMGADGFVPEGYVACRKCGEWMVKPSRKAIVCASCRETAAEIAGVIETARAVAGRRVPTRPTRGRKARPLSDADKERKRAWNAARSAALLRLSRIYGPMYEVLLAEEKAKRGLDPGIDSRDPGAGPIERELVGR